VRQSPSFFVEVAWQESRRYRETVEVWAVSLVANRQMGEGMYWSSIRSQNVRIDHCEATEGIRERLGLENALSYLIGEKTLQFRSGIGNSTPSLPASCRHSWWK